MESRAKDVTEWAASNAVFVPMLVRCNSGSRAVKDTDRAQTIVRMLAERHDKRNWESVADKTESKGGVEWISA